MPLLFSFFIFSRSLSPFLPASLTYFGSLGGLHNGEAHGAEAPDGHGAVGLDLGGVEDGAKAGGDAAAQEAHLLQRRVVGDLCAGDLRDDGVLAVRECAREQHCEQW